MARAANGRSGKVERKMSGSNQAALITGGAKRIGKAVALALAAQGYDIALHCNRSAEAANLVRNEVLAVGQQCSVFAADLTDEGELFGLIQNVFEVFPRLSLLINNASIFEPGSLLDTELDLFQRHMDVNLRAPFFLMRDFARFAEQGHIINLVDARILAVPTGYTAYSVSKAALHALTRMLALELAPGFRVNAIAPGLILPPPGQPESYLDRLAGKVPLKRSGSPESVVKAVFYLLGNEFVTGECLRLDGGEWLS